MFRDGFRKAYDLAAKGLGHITEGAFGFCGFMSMAFGAGLVSHGHVIAGLLLAVAGMITLGRAGELRVKDARLKGFEAAVALITAARESRINITAYPHIDVDLTLKPAPDKEA
jgi:hypothetical protein